MMVARGHGSITWAAPAFERGFAAIALDVHLQDGGVVNEPARHWRRHRDTLAHEIEEDVELI